MKLPFILSLMEFLWPEIDPIVGVSSLGEKLVVGEVLTEFFKFSTLLMNCPLLLLMEFCDVKNGKSVGEFLKDLAVWKESAAKLVELSLVDGAMFSEMASR